MSQIKTKYIEDSAIINAKMADMVQDTFKGRKTASTGAPEDISMSDALDMLGLGVQDKRKVFASDPTTDAQAPAFRQLLEVDLEAFTDITTGNASASKHGLLPKLSDVEDEFFNGKGNYVPIAQNINVISAANQIWVDGSRTDSYTEDGTFALPYKTFTAALNDITGGSISNQFTIVCLDPSTYDEVIYFDPADHDYVHLYAPFTSFINTTGGNVIEIDSDYNQITIKDVHVEYDGGSQNGIEIGGDYVTVNFNKVYVLVNLGYPQFNSGITTVGDYSIIKGHYIDHNYEHTVAYSSGALNLQGNHCIIDITHIKSTMACAGTRVVYLNYTDSLNLSINQISIDATGSCYIFNAGSSLGGTSVFRVGYMNVLSGTAHRGFKIASFATGAEVIFDIGVDETAVNMEIQANVSKTLMVRGKYAYCAGAEAIYTVYPTLDYKVERPTVIYEYAYAGTVVTTGDIYEYDTTSGGLEPTWSDFTSHTDKQITFKNTGSNGNTLTLNPYSSGTIDGQTTYDLEDGESITVLHKGSNVFVTLYKNSVTTTIVSNRWTLVHSGKYTAEPDTDSVLLMSDTSDVAVGLPVKYTYNSNTYYGQIVAMTANTSITIAGVPFDSGTPYDVTKLYVGTADMVVNETFIIPGNFDGATYTAGASGGILYDLSNMPMHYRWKRGDAYLVKMSTICLTEDSSGSGNYATISAEVSSDNSTYNDAFSAFIDVEEDEANTGVTVDSSHYDLAYGDYIDFTNTEGTNNESMDLQIELTFVLE